MKRSVRGTITAGIAAGFALSACGGSGGNPPPPQQNITREAQVREAHIRDGFAHYWYHDTDSEFVVEYSEPARNAVPVNLYVPVDGDWLKPLITAPGTGSYPAVCTYHPGNITWRVFDLTPGSRESQAAISECEAIAQASGG